MTVAFTTAQKTSLGNDSTKVFDFGFPIYALADMQVFLTDITTGLDTEQLSNFTVNPATPGIFPTVGTVTFPVTGSPIDTNTKITLRRKTPYAQEFLDLKRRQFINGGELEDAIDRVVGMVQQNQTLNLRSLKVGLTEAELSVQEFVDTLLIPTVVGAIIDNLTTAVATQALSANQGVVLKALIDALPIVIDNLTTTSAINSLSANQGFVLKGLIDALPVVLDTLLSNSTTDSLSANQGLILKGLIDALPIVIDNLLSTSATNSLSANQGLILKGLIDALAAAPLKSNQAENEAGTDDAKFVSPLGLREAFESTGTPSGPLIPLRAWVSYDGIFNTIFASDNLLSVTDFGTGDYEFVFAAGTFPGGIITAFGNASANNDATSITLVARSATTYRVNIFDLEAGGVDKTNLTQVDVSAITMGFTG